ncbi:hypothetical protein [Thermoanaerobacterium aotearoense]|uniref:hypothetical protein n=1 Tax=Thermoanaerobacterium aotearoense TaxID=47490 RepID=UPI001378DA8D|nr:hypothetical protein [Thermoanaerobacterium aotearoense]
MLFTRNAVRQTLIKVELKIQKWYINIRRFDEERNKTPEKTKEKAVDREKIMW